MEKLMKILGKSTPKMFALALSGLALLAPQAQAAEASSAASITIDGKTVNLPYLRAWSMGTMMEVPVFKVLLSEKPLDDWSWDEHNIDTPEGKFGITLEIGPEPNFGSSDDSHSR